jgi:F0F1-type ATP synthase assembly protein I
MARAMVWTSHLTSIGLEMALPALGGYGLDRWLGTSPIFLIVATILGFVTGFLHLLRLAKTEEARQKAENSARDAKDRDF